MALTNAERQARFRERLREQASITSLAERGRQVCEKALQILWEQAARDSCADFDTFENVEALRAHIESGKDRSFTLVALCRANLEDWRDRFTADELTVLEAVVGLDDALRLKVETPRN